MNGSVKRLQERFDEAIEKYGFFDFDFWDDPYDVERFYTAPDTDAALKKLKKTCRAGGLITEGAAVTVDPATGNERLVGRLSAEDGLLGCMVLTPDPEFSGRALQDYLDRMTGLGFAAIRLLPKRFYHSVSDSVCGEILSAAQERGLPLVISHAETSWDAIDSLCSRRPGLNVLVEGGNAVKIIYHNRDYIALLKKHRNLYLDTHALVWFSEIESLCSLVGAEKLIFGSNAVYDEPGTAIGAVAFARISEEEKLMIAHGNAMRLLKPD